VDVPEEYIPCISDLEKKEINNVIKNFEQLEEKKVIDRSVKKGNQVLMPPQKLKSDGISCIPMYKAADRVATDQKEN